MAAPYHNLLSKNDRALVAYLVAQLVAAASLIVPAKRSADKTAPLVACWSERAVETAPYSGTYTITASIMVKTVGALDAGQGTETPRLASEDLTGKTFDAFHKDLDSAGDKLAADITAAARALAVSDPTNHADLADYTCLNVIIKGPEAGFDGDVWVDTLNLEMVACPANVS